MKPFPFRAFSLLLFVSIMLPMARAQHSFRMPHASNDILHRLESIQRAGRVLYLAAHPDDENTQAIAHLARKEDIRTAYLSLTRGGGGQNLIGPERGELLSVLRTQELLEARRIDGGRQFFSRARDFGYSKSAEETLEFWGKERTLKDVVRVIRKFKPDVIITRFPKEGYEGAHGHHTASAILASEAFGKSGDPEVFPEQAEELGTWKPERLLFNTSTWWDQELPEKVKGDEDLFRVNVGKYDPYSGLSYTEIAAQARSMHKCQGFGVEEKRGVEWEYFKVLKDRTDLKGSPKSIMDGIPTELERYKGAEKMAQHLRKARKEFDPARPEAIVSRLVKAYRALDRIKNKRWKEEQRPHLRRLILACSGTYVEAITEDPSASPGDSSELELELTHRSQVPIKVGKVQVGAKDTSWGLNPEENQENTLRMEFYIPEDKESHTHHWLKRTPLKGVYRPPERQEGGIVRPEPPAAIRAEIHMKIEGVPMKIRNPVENKNRSRTRGGVYEPFRVLPPVTASSSGKARIFPTSKTRTVEIEYRSHSHRVKAKVGLELPEGWGSKPSSRKLRIQEKGGRKRLTFEITPPDTFSKGDLVPYAIIDGTRYRYREDRIRYDHIIPQQVIRPSGSRVVRLKTGEREGKLGYIMGSGDEVPHALRQMGYTVDLLPPEELGSVELQDYDVLITGIRAFNVNEALRYQNERLFQYAENGGHLIIQYNKDDDALVTQKIAPYELVPSGEHRVTEEKAKAKLLEPDHPIFTHPNTIDKSDFQGWVQERGLYFASEWGEEFKPLIAWNDRQESPKKGGLLLAEHGKGSILYTGIAFFRQLPAGVPGAYRLFDNFVQYGLGSRKP